MASFIGCRCSTGFTCARCRSNVGDVFGGNISRQRPAIPARYPVPSPEQRQPNQQLMAHSQLQPGPEMADKFVRPTITNTNSSRKHRRWRRQANQAWASHPLLKNGTLSVMEWAAVYAGGGSVCPPVGNVDAAIQFSFLDFLPGDFRGPCGAYYVLTAPTLWWYLTTHQFSYNESLEMLTRFFSTVADRLGLSSSSPDGRGLPDHPLPATVYPPDVFRDSAALDQYKVWAAAHAPMQAPASYDPERLARRRGTPRSGLQKVVRPGEAPPVPPRPHAAGGGDSGGQVPQPTQETRRLDIEECVKRMISADLNGTNLDKPSESVVNILLRSHDEHATIDDLNGLRGLVAHLPRPDDSDAANEQSQAFSEILDKLGRNDRTPPGPATWPDNPMEIKDPPAGKHNNKSDEGADTYGDFTSAVKQWGSSLIEDRGGGDLHDITQHMVDNGFTVVPGVLSRWRVKVVELYHDLLDRTQRDVFRLFDETASDGAPDGRVIGDAHRKITDIGTDRLLASNIVGPTTEAMRQYGFLDIHDEAGRGERVSRDGSFIRSLAYRTAKDIKYQGFHTEGDTSLADEQGVQFALYTLTAGSRGGEVHLYPGHMGGDPAKYGNVDVPLLPVRVFLQPGDMLVMTGGTRHRGVGYLADSDRLFVSFKAGKSWPADESSTFDLQVVGDPSEEFIADKLESWSVPPEWRAKGWRVD